MFTRSNTARRRLSGASLANRTKKISWSLVRGVILFGLCFEIVYPFFVKIMQTFMTKEDLVDPTIKLYPLHWTLSTLRQTFTEIEFVPAAFNSLILSLTVSVLQMMICTLVGYGLARFKFRGRNLLFFMVILTLIIPPQLYSITQYLYFYYFGVGQHTVNLIGTYWPFLLLSLTGMGMKNGLYIFLMRQFFRGLPKELEDAAYIDGCGIFGTYLRVILPNARNMLITVFVLSFSWQWTDYFFSSMLLGAQQVTNLPLAIINNIQLIRTGGERVDPILYAVERNTACLLAIIPLLILFAFLQKKLINGIERSGLVE
ncbi:MAG: carbohydrate ABC transporter permease [Clostridia bacterium]|nr:carbohydrate ABC transporter permease [Clostridia bacterium]